MFDDEEEDDEEGRQRVGLEESSISLDQVSINCISLKTLLRNGNRPNVSLCKARGGVHAFNTSPFLSVIQSTVGTSHFALS